MTNTQVGPSAAQCPTLLPNFNSSFVRIDVKPFKTLLMRLELVMGRSLTAELGMHHVPAKFMPSILTADQKQRHVSVCEELRQIASDNATFLSRVITGDKSWI
jgi:hypothetical protein